MPRSSGASTSELYAAAIEMASFAESRGALAVAVCEHHTMADGYLPSPLVLATAMAARTDTLPIMTAALVLPLYDPIRLAEDMIVLDIISGGRVSYIMAIGYRPEEYEHHGADFSHRGRLVENQLALLLRAKSGEPFEHEGRHIHVTPAPVTPGGPTVIWGGGSPAAAKRAARFGLDFIAQGGGAGLEEIYASEARAHGREPGVLHDPVRRTLPPPSSSPTISTSPGPSWARTSCTTSRSYAALNPGNTHTASISTATSAEELRKENRTHRIVTVDEARSMIGAGIPLPLHPLIGGLPPETAWRYLRTVTDDVMHDL